MLRVPVLAAALSVAAVLALPAAAVPIPRPPGDHQITTAHFVVHYYTDMLSDGTPAPDYSTETQAGDVAAYAERAYSLETGWGFPAPVDDGDGRIDIYLTDLSALTGTIGYADPDAPGGSPDSGAIVLSTPDEMAGFAKDEGLSVADEEQKSIAHELFHLVQYATWVPSSQSDTWLLEGSAQWAGFKAIGYPSGSAVADVGPPEIALNCRDNLPDHQMCDAEGYVEGGYSRWAFFEMLAQKYGLSFVHDVLVNGAAGQSATTALANAIAAKGSTLSALFTDYANHFMVGDFGVAALASIRPRAHDAVTVGSRTFTTTTIAKVPVNHLAARYVTFRRGDGNSASACFASTLTITVGIPAGTSAQPYFYWDAPGGSLQALAISGSNASITVPWDTCNWGSVRGWLSLPNPTTGVDAADFTVSMSQTVDFNTPATATPPPDPASVWGTTVPVPTNDIAPTIDVFGPELIKLSAKTRTIRLIVESSGEGTLRATLGSAALGSRTLRAGNNDLRYTIPAGMLRSLRRTAAAANVLTLTPVSAAGAVGTPVTRHVAVTATAAKKKHKK